MTNEQVEVQVERDHTHAASNGKTELSLEALARLQPSVARLMLEIGERFWRCYHAAKAQNRRLARFQLSEGTKLLKQCVVVRPQYDEDMTAFIDGELAALRAAIDEGDWAGFESAFSTMTASVNRLHGDWNHGFLVWQVPEQPPADLVLEPRAEDR
ncbi:MAG: hypothetical protein M0014_10170 [Actinomycetota bacterium]|nr:hypothetical protein [Actinomycetota bacterium]